MKLTEFIRQNDIKFKAGEEFDHTPEFFKMKEFERASHMIYGVPFWKEETGEVKEFDVMLTGIVQEKWDAIHVRIRGTGIIM